MSAPAVHTPADLPDLRLWLADQWQRGKPFHASAAPYHAMRADHLRAELRGQGQSTDADRYARHEWQTLVQATLWWVAEPMVDLLIAAAAGLPDDTMYAELPPMPANGLVVFAKPWLGIDGYTAERRVQVDALAWGMVSVPESAGPGRRLALAMSTYRRLSFDDGLAGDELQLATQVGAMAHGDLRPLLKAQAPLADRLDQVEDQRPSADHEVAHSLPGGQVPGEAHGTVVSPTRGVHARLVGTTWVPLGRSDWPVTDPIGVGPWNNEPELVQASMVEDRKVVAAMWHLLHQEGIAQQTSHAPERQAMRRTQRAGIERKLATVQVVTLRKLHRTESAPTDEHASRDWTHRWLVAGHWRWARVGVGRTERRLTYVRPHVKGPEDKPLRVPTRVNAWQR